MRRQNAIINSYVKWNENILWSDCVWNPHLLPPTQLSTRNERLNGWMDEWMTGWVSEWVNRRNEVKCIAIPFYLPIFSYFLSISLVISRGFYGPGHEHVYFCVQYNTHPINIYALPLCRHWLFTRVADIRITIRQFSCPPVSIQFKARPPFYFTQEVTTTSIHSETSNAVVRIAQVNIFRHRERTKSADHQQELSLLIYVWSRYLSSLWP